MINQNKTPLYLQIRSDIQNKINSGEWKEGFLIPSEKELCGYYNVSRVTIRCSIRELVKNGILSRRAGYGTTVENNLYSISNFTLIKSDTSEMSELGITLRNIEAGISLIKSNSFLASIFSIPIGSPLYCLKRLRGGNFPILYSTTYLLPIIQIDNAVITESLYKYLGKNGIYFEQFIENISAVEATPELSRALQTDNSIPLLKRTRKSYDINHNIIEYSETFYNSKVYEYHTNISLKSRVLK